MAVHGAPKLHHCGMCVTHGLPHRPQLQYADFLLLPFAQPKHNVAKTKRCRSHGTGSPARGQSKAASQFIFKIEKKRGDKKIKKKKKKHHNTKASKLSKKHFIAHNVFDYQYLLKMNKKSTSPLQEHKCHWHRGRSAQSVSPLGRNNFGFISHNLVIFIDGTASFAVIQ